MILKTEEILQNALVVSIDNERFLAFKKAFEEQNLKVPKLLNGYEIDLDYCYSHFLGLITLKFEKKENLIESETQLLKATWNNCGHYFAVVFAKLLNWPFVTIFEDDAVPIQNCRAKLDAYCADIPDETDVLRLGYAFRCKNRTTQQNLIDNAVPHSENLIVKNVPGSHAYVVFKKYYDCFIESNKHYPRCDFAKINPSIDKNVFCLKESLFNQVNLKDRSVISSWKLPDGKVIVNR